MSGSTLFVILLVGLPLLMVLMHRGGHSGMGCGMGHGGHGSHRGHDEHGGGAHAPDTDAEEKRPLLGSPRTGGTAPTPVRSAEHGHRGS